MHHQRDVHSTFMGVLLVPLEWECCRLAPSPRGSWCGSVARRSRRGAPPPRRASSRIPLKNFISWSTPNGPPSCDAPLSPNTMMMVLSSSPSASKSSTSRPIWASVWSRKAAKASCRRHASSLLVRTVGRPRVRLRGCRGARAVPAGITPMSSWLANQRARTTSQPSS